MGWQSLPPYRLIITPRWHTPVPAFSKLQQLFGKWYDLRTVDSYLSGQFYSKNRSAIQFVTLNYYLKNKELKMEDVTFVGQDVTIVAYYFKDKKRPKCFPKKMEYGGRTVIFTETGLRHPTHRGKRMVHVFDMTDGQADYRLEFDAEALRWRLIYIADQAEGLQKLAYAPAA